MASLTARALQWVLRTTRVYKKLFAGGPGFAVHQAKALANPSEPSAKIRAALLVERTEFAGRPVWTIGPRSGAPTADMLFWHGGGYVYPASPAHWDFFAHMARTHGWRVTVPLYPLAPMQQVDAITGFAMDFYRDFVGRRAGQAFFMAGDSAGGGMTAAVLMAARDAGLALPAKAILICPWLLANPAHPDQPGIERHDAILTLRGIREAGEMYAGAAGVDDPRVSPLHGNWSGLPPILAFGGTTDILLTDARGLKAKLPSVEYVEGEGLMHDWPLFFFPESRAAQRRMAAFASA